MTKQHKSKPGPKPIDRTGSRQLSVRVGRSLHSRLVQRARAAGIPLTTLARKLLEAGENLPLSLG